MGAWAGSIHGPRAGIANSKDRLAEGATPDTNNITRFGKEPIRGK